MAADRVSEKYPVMSQKNSRCLLVKLKIGGNMDAYKFDPSTKEFRRKIEAQEEPYHPGEYALPANATFSAPPEYADKQIPVWNGTSWEIREDHRRHVNNKGQYEGGTPYWLPSEGDNWQSDPRYMTEIGPLPEGAVTTRPEKTEQEIQEENLKNTIYESESYLNETDYRVIKFMDAYISAHPEVLAEFEAEYPDTLSKRQEARDNINGAQASAQIAGINLDEQNLLA